MSQDQELGKIPTFGVYAPDDSFQEQTTKAEAWERFEALAKLLEEQDASDARWHEPEVLRNDLIHYIEQCAIFAPVQRPVLARLEHEVGVDGRLKIRARWVDGEST